MHRGRGALSRLSVYSLFSGFCNQIIRVPVAKDRFHEIVKLPCKKMAGKSRMIRITSKHRERTVKLIQVPKN